MTGGTVAIHGVVIIMTCDAGSGFRIGIEADRRSVALHALDLAMLRVLKNNWSLPTLVLGHADHHGDRAGWGKLLIGMNAIADSPASPATAPPLGAAT